MDVDAFLSGCIFGVGRSTVYCAIERQRNEARAATTPAVATN